MRMILDGHRAAMRRCQVIRRDRNRAAGRCVNENAAGTHGPATHGVRCERCDVVWRRSR